MKTKVMVVVVTMLFALSLMAQTATQTAPASTAAGDAAKTCACCSGDKADAKAGDKCPMMKDGTMADGMACCGKDGGCCKDGKCDMAAHKDGRMACCSDGKCNMAAHKEGKGCCGDKCPMMKGEKSGAKSSGKNDGCCKTTAAVSCCAKGAACCKNGNLPCCDASRTAA